MPFDSVLAISFISIPKSQVTARPGGAAVEVAWDGIGNKSILSFLEGKKDRNHIVSIDIISYFLLNVLQIA